MKHSDLQRLFANMKERPDLLMAAAELEPGDPDLERIMFELGVRTDANQRNVALDTEIGIVGGEPPFIPPRSQDLAAQWCSEPIDRNCRLTVSFLGDKTQITASHKISPDEWQYGVCNLTEDEVGELIDRLMFPPHGHRMWVHS